MPRKLSILLLITYGLCVVLALRASIYHAPPTVTFWSLHPGTPVSYPGGVTETKYSDGTRAKLTLEVGRAGLILECSFLPDGTITGEGLLDGAAKCGVWINGQAMQVGIRAYPYKAVPPAGDPFTSGSGWVNGRLQSEMFECGDSGLRLERGFYDDGALQSIGFRQDGEPIGMWLMLDEHGAITTKCMSPEWRVRLRGGS